MTLGFRGCASHFITMVVLSAAVVPAAAQKQQAARPKADAPIQFRNDAKEAIDDARRRKLPLLIFVPGERSARWERENREDAQNETFRDAEVVRMVNARFVPLQLQRTSENTELFVRLGLGASPQLTGVIATPSGEPIQKIDFRELSRPQRMLKNLNKGFQAYVSKLYTDEIAPLLREANAPSPKVAAALKTIAAHDIETADADVVALLDRVDDAALRKQACAVLADLSTKASVEALLARAEKNKDVAALLKKCSPAALPALADALNEAYDAKHVAAYDACCAILKDKQVKGAQFWKNASDEQKKAEVARTRKLVAAAAAESESEDDAP